MVRLNSSQATEEDHRAWQRWYEQGQAQQRAWGLAKSVTSRFEMVPAGMDTTELVGDVRSSRRQALKAISALLIAPPIVWAVAEAPWGELTADHRTATGEQRSLALADGTRVVLNTASAIDVNFNSVRRLVHLWAGEIMVVPGADFAAANRPLVLRTAQGEVRASGGRFSAHVRNSSSTNLCALDGRLEIHPASAGERAYMLGTGRQADFDSSGVVQERAIDANAELWTQGLLFASEMRLSDLVSELARYRRGILRCDPAVADLRVSGVFQLNDIDKVFVLLEKSHPVSVRTVAPGWTVVEKR